MSLAEKIIKRLMLTTLVGTCVAYGWLYLKAVHVQTLSLIHISEPTRPY